MRRVDTAMPPGDQLAHHAGCLHLRIDTTWPWAHDLAGAFQRPRLALPGP